MQFESEKKQASGQDPTDMPEMDDGNEHPDSLRLSTLKVSNAHPPDESFRRSCGDSEEKQSPSLEKDEHVEYIDVNTGSAASELVSPESITLLERITKGTEASSDDQPVSTVGRGPSVVLLISRYAGSLITLVAVLTMTIADLCVEVTTAVLDPLQVNAIFATAMFSVSLSLSVLLLFMTDSRVFRCFRERGSILFLSLCGLANSGALTLINVSINFIPVGDAISILRCMPIFAGIFGYIFLKQPFKFLDVLLSLLCIIGVVLIVRPTFIFRPEDGVEDSEKLELLGAALSLLSAVLFAVSYVIGPKLDQRNIHPFVIITVNAFFTVVINVILAIASNSWTGFTELYLLGITVGGGAFHAVGQILVFVALTKTRTVVVSVILASEIIFIYILQIVIVRIVPHWLSAVGASVILVSCVGISVRRDRHSSPDAVE